MRERPLLSVIVITYNQEKYISQTIDSILSQEQDYPYEIVIGEDCSSDGTKGIIEEYAKKYPEIVKPIYNNPNLGLIKNYFNTLSHCSGKYIMECAGDDYWLPGKVEKQIKFMEANPNVGMCYGVARVWSEETRKFQKELMGAQRETIQEIVKSCIIPAATVCFRNDLIKKYVKEINPVEKDWLMEDFPMWLWISKESKIQFLNEEFAVYRKIENSISHSLDVEKHIKLNISGEKIIRFFADYYEIPLNTKTESDIRIHNYFFYKKFQECRRMFKEATSRKYQLLCVLSFFPFLAGIVVNQKEIIKRIFKYNKE